MAKKKEEKAAVETVETEEMKTKYKEKIKELLEIGKKKAKYPGIPGNQRFFPGSEPGCGKTGRNTGYSGA